MHRPTLTLTLTATLAILTTGCTNNPDPPPITDPPATTTTTVTEEELTPNPQLAAEREATQTLKDFYAASDQLGQSGYEDLSPITWFVVGDDMRPYRDELGWLRSQNAVQVGETTQTNFKVVDHHAVEDPFFDDQLTIEVCVDNTDADVRLPDGSSVIPPNRKGRFVATATMWHDMYEDTWVIAGYFTDGGRPC